MAILDITLRLGSATHTEGSSQTSPVPSLTNRVPIELSSSLPSPIFLLQSSSTVQSHPQSQCFSPTDKATECCSPTEEELTTDFEDDDSLYYDCETSLTGSSSFMMDEHDSESIESQQTSGSLNETLDSCRDEAMRDSRIPRLTALRDQTQDHPPSYSRTQLLDNTRFDIGFEDSFEKLEPVVPIARCELLKLDTPSLKSSQRSSSSEKTLNSNSKSSKGLIPSETSTSLVEDHAKSSGCLVFDHLKILLSQLDIPDNDSPKYHVAWAFDGRFTKPKPSAAFDSIAFEFKQMQNDSTMPGENLKKKIDLLEIQRRSKFLAKLSSIELYQVPKFIKHIDKTPSWAVLKPLGPTASVTFATATALLA